MCDDDDDDESCNKCYALIIVVFKRRDLRKMCRVFLSKKKLLFLISLKKKCRHTRVAGVYIRSFKTIRITYVHVKGAGILVINTGNTYHSSFYANARSKTLVKSVKK